MLVKIIPEGLEKGFRDLLYRFNGMGLDRKLILLYVTIVAIPIIIFGVYAFGNNEKSLTASALNNAVQDIRDIVNLVNRNIEICEIAAQTVISDEEFNDFINSTGEVSTEDSIKFRMGPLENVQRIQSFYKEIHQLRIYTANQRIPEMWPTIYDESYILKQPWREKVNSFHGSVLWQINHPAVITDDPGYSSEPVVSLYREMTNISNRHAGILEVNMRVETFFGEMLSGHRDPDSIMCFISDSNEIVADITGGNRVLNLVQDDRNPLKKQLDDRAVNKSEGCFSVSLGGENAIAAYARIDKLYGTILKIISVKGLTRNLDSTRNIILLGSMLSIVLLSLLTYFLTSIMLKKMKKIISFMRKVQNGKLELEIPPMGNDEFGEMASHFKKMLGKVNELISIVARKQSAAKDAEIKTLHAQINAHFIYNVLENIKMMALIERKFEISNALTSLGKLMRYSMKWENQYVLLREEIDYIRNYIALLNIRYDGGIKLKIDASDELLNCEVLKMTIQPIVENAVLHGLEPRNFIGTIVINAFRDDSFLFIEVNDDGIGMSQGELELLETSIETGSMEAASYRKGNGIGLKNVNERIKIFYGEEFGLKVSSVKDEFTKVLVRFSCS